MVDVEDDNIRRFVVQQYRFDPERHERRDVVVAAFDNEDEFIELIKSIEADISQRAEDGAFVGPLPTRSTPTPPGDAPRADARHGPGRPTP